MKSPVPNRKRLAKAEVLLAELEAEAEGFSDIEEQAAGLEQREAGPPAETAGC